MRTGLSTRSRLAGGLAAGLVLAPGVGFAQDLQALQSRLEALEAQLKAQSDKIDAQAAEIRELKAARSGAQVVHEPPAAVLAPLRPDEAPAPPSAPAVASLPNGRPTFVSADGRFDASLRAIVHFDWADYIQDSPAAGSPDLRRAATAAQTPNAQDLSSGFALRRGRIGLDGKVFGDFDYNLMLEFGGGGDARLVQGWGQYNGMAPLYVRVGVFAPSDDLEGNSPKNAFPMLETAGVVEVARTLAGSDGRFAAQVFGYGERWHVSAALTGATVNTAGDFYDDQSAVIGRVAGRPLFWRDGFLHLGAEYTYVLQPPDLGPAAGAERYSLQFSARPEVRVDNTRLIGTGPVPADHGFTNAVEFAFQQRNFLLHGEYNRFGIDRPAGPLPDPRFSGWYISANWILTGERRRYNTQNASLDGPQVARPFDPSTGALGAFELSGRYSVVDLNWRAGREGEPTPVGGVRGGEQRTIAAGVNWYLNQAVRLMLGMQDVRIRRLSPDPIAFATPVGAEIGQHFKVVTFRSQLAF